MLNFLNGLCEFIGIIINLCARNKWILLVTAGIILFVLFAMLSNTAMSISGGSGGMVLNVLILLIGIAAMGILIIFNPFRR